MKTKFLLVLFSLTIAGITSATDKYTSTEFGFAASFPSEVVSSQIGPDVFQFKASGPGNAWEAQVKVSQNVAMPQEITKDFMKAKLSEVIKSGGMKQSGAISYTTCQNYPSVLANAAFVVDNTRSNEPSYATLVNLKLVFVKSRNPAKGNNRIYMVDGLAIQGQGRSGIEQFLNSFEVK
jgi:hypothetical protein